MLKRPRPEPAPTLALRAKKSQPIRVGILVRGGLSNKCRNASSCKGLRFLASQVTHKVTHINQCQHGLRPTFRPLQLHKKEAIARKAKAQQEAQTDILRNSAECSPIDTRTEIAKAASTVGLAVPEARLLGGNVAVSSILESGKIFPLFLARLSASIALRRFLHQIT